MVPRPARLGQAIPRTRGTWPTAGLKQPSLWGVTDQTLGRRNAALVQSTGARPGPLNHRTSPLYRSRVRTSFPAQNQIDGPASAHVGAGAAQVVEDGAVGAARLFQRVGEDWQV